MHIAHSQPGEFLSVGQIEKLTGLKRRQIANLARRRAIPGARLSANGYHYEYPVSRALRDWIMWKEFEISRRKQCKLSEADKESPLMPESPEPNSRQTGIANLPGIRQMFDVWHKLYSDNYN